MGDLSMEHSPGESGHIDTDERPAQVPANNDFFWDGYIDEHAAAEFVGFSVAFLQNLRYRGGGAVYSKINKNVRYTRRRLKAWADARILSSTSEAA